MAYNRIKNEQFQDMIARLFPEHNIQNSITCEGCNDQKHLVRPVTFQVTDACNLRCKYCYQINKQHHKMPFEVAKKFIDMLLSYKTCEDNPYINCENTPGISIEFIGGEPWLEIDLIDQITDYFIKRMLELHHPWATKYMISICSNGILHMEPKVQAYLKKHKDRLSYSITIDGDKALHDSARVFEDGVTGSYDIAIKGVENWLSMGGKMGSKITLAPQNIDKTFSAVKHFIEYGYDDININCVYEEGWTLEHAKTLYNELKKVADYMLDKNIVNDIRLAMFEETFFKPKAEDDINTWCGGNASMISVDWKGDIYPCIRYMESSLGSSREPIIVGNVDEGLVTKPEWEEIMNSMRAVTRRTQNTDECFYCPIAAGCSDCQAYNYQMYGTLNHRATFICCMHKARALANVYFWNKWYKQSNENKRFHNYVPDDWALEIIDQTELDMLKQLENDIQDRPIINDDPTIKKEN